MDDDADRKQLDAAADRMNGEAEDVLGFQSAFTDEVDAEAALERITAASQAADRVEATHWIEELAQWRRAIEDAEPGNVGSVLPGAMDLVRHIEEAIGGRGWAHALHQIRWNSCVRVAMAMKTEWPITDSLKAMGGCDRAAGSLTLGIRGLASEAD